MKLLPFFIFALFGLSACNTINSEDVKTSGISFSTDITSATGTDSEVVVFLTSGNGFPANDVNLSVGDTLTATASGTTRTLSRTSAGVYKVAMPTGYSADFRVALTRDNDTNAPNSTVTLPAPFALSAPSPSQFFTNGSNITMDWSPTNMNNTFSFSYTTTCTDTVGQPLVGSGFSKVIPDTGSYTFNTTDLLPTFGSVATTQPCSSILTLSRSNTGIVDPNYDSGSMKASQNRSITISFAP